MDFSGFQKYIKDENIPICKKKKSDMGKGWSEIKRWNIF